MVEALPPFSECKPIKNLQELWEWKPTISTTPLQSSGDRCVPGWSWDNYVSNCYRPRVPGDPRRHIPMKNMQRAHKLPRKGLTKTLICHDMKGGYLDDKYLTGSRNPSAYRFVHWSVVDTFVYFSHNFITVPPPGWIHCAHLHGVKILGTIITEYEDGLKLCKEFLASTAACKRFISTLVRLTLYYGFDGWLLNIENVIDFPRGTERMIGFVEELTQAVHSALPGSQVLWYDSVTADTGELQWQNELNLRNTAFFDACDGIFLNYTWTSTNLKNSVKMAAKRKNDVYVGVDVFGRGCYGGGGFNTRAAIQEIRSVDRALSVAIFAPAWVYEANNIEFFPENDCKFWRLLSEYLYYRACPVELPFGTSFCQGSGLRTYHQGAIVTDSSWFDLSCQQFQPPLTIAPEGDDDNKSLPRLCGTLSDAFEGGSCLTATAESAADFRILVCHFSIPQRLLLSYAIKKGKEYNEVDVDIVLVTAGREIILGDTLLCPVNFPVPIPGSHIHCLDSRDIPDYKQESSEVADVEIPSDAHEGWVLRHYLLEGYGSSAVEEIWLRVHAPVTLYLGWLSAVAIQAKDNANDVM